MKFEWDEQKNRINTQKHGISFEDAKATFKEKQTKEREGDIMSLSREQRLKKLDEIKDKEIDYSDIPELDDSFWANAVLEYPEKKKPVTLRLDSDVLDWFRSLGKGYQTRINSVLRSFYEAHKKKVS